MFLYPGFVSLNSREDLRPGDYHGVCTVYVERGSGAMALLSEYTLVNERTPRVAELQMVEAEGQVVRFLDFVRMPDCSWRDSHGLRGDTLGSLVPAFLASYVFFEQVETGIQRVEAAHG